MSKSILLVEDEILISMNTKKTLETEGYKVSMKNSGLSAIDALDDDSNHIDLILMDINLGSGINGIEAAEIILKGHNIPLIFLSSYQDRHTLEKIESITNYGYIVKGSSDHVIISSVKMAFKLFEAKSQTSEVFDHSINGICIHKMLYDSNGDPSDCRYLRVNNSFYQNTGLLRELEGKTIRDLYPEGEADHLVEMYSRVLMSGVSLRKEIYFEPTQRWFELSVFPIKRFQGEFVVVVQNITKRKTYEKKLLDSERTLRDIFESIFAGFWDWDLVSNTEYLSPSFKKMFGYENHELENSPLTWQKLIFKEDLPGVFEIFNKHVESHGVIPFYNEVRYTHKDGSTVWVLCAGKVIEWAEDGSPVRMVGCHIDISSIKKLEKEKDDILREAHHRMKNSLSVIEGLVSIQLEKTKAEEAQNVLIDMKGRIQSMSIVYDKLLETKNSQNISSTEYLDELIKSVVRIFKNGSSVEIVDDIDNVILNSKQMFALGVIVNEFITNSMKYAFKGEEKETIFISLKKSDDKVLFVIKDNGHGIDESLIYNTENSFGMLLIHNMCQQLFKDYIIYNDNGVKLTASLVL